LAPLDGEAPRLSEEPVLAMESRMAPVDEDGDTGKDSGNESIEADSDSEDKKESMKAIQNAMVGMNVSPEFLSASVKYSRSSCNWIM
jgi:hypothetical protein